MPVPGSQRSSSARATCGLRRLPGALRTSTSLVTLADRSSSAMRSALAVPCPKVISGTGPGLLSAARQVAGALLKAQLTVGVVGRPQVAGRVQFGGLPPDELKVSSAEVGLQLPHGTGTENRRGDARPGGDPGHRDLGHTDAAPIGNLAHHVDHLPGALGPAPVVGFHAAARVLAKAG